MKEYREKGIGKRLLESIIQEGKKAGFHSVMARIAEGSEASIHLCEALGFEHVGVMKEAGRKFGRLLDVYLMQKML
jgi:phosphinothricin acetyltransferase